MNRVFVQNEENYIYEINFKEICMGNDIKSMTIFLDLKLIAGIDYINPDENNIQGYVNASRFTDNIQNETIVVYTYRESIENSLKENGYKIIESLPDIH